MTFPFEVAANVSHSQDETLGPLLLSLEQRDFCRVFQQGRDKLFYFSVFYLE